MMKMAAATTMGRVPAFRPREEGDADAMKVEVNGVETDPIVARAAQWYLVEIASVLALISGSFTFYYVVGSVVDLMSLCVVFLAPVLTVQGTRLRKLGGLRHQHNLLRENVGRLGTENNKLTISVATLTTHTVKLKQVQESLERVAKKSGQSVDRLVALVRENGNVQKEIHDNLQAQVLQEIVTVAVQTDRDRNFILSAKEVDALLVRIKNLPGVEVDEQVFRTHIKSDKGELTLVDVCQITRLLKDEATAAFQLKAGLAASKEKLQSAMKQKQAAMFRFRPKDLLKHPVRR
jgi:hypothetical protein